ncbi:MAG TPA: type III pantothenate kinase [Planctomycetota bacterium]|nr:type III pantothenate kinase [Planctomycetota bacterium]
MRLLADCGNSTIKLGLAQDGGIWQFQRLDPKVAALDDFIKPFDRTITELVVMPGARANTMIVEAWWDKIGSGRRKRMVGEESLPVPDLGQYPNCGIDRVLAGLVGTIQERKPLVVIDAGTATTMTAWSYEIANPDPLSAVQFRGGLILPGARSCAVGLATLAPALPVVEILGPDAHAVQFDTQGAIGAAIGIGYGPMVAACMLKLERETGIRDHIATGGNVGLIIDSLVLPRLSYRPSLVLEGLELLCRITDRTRRSSDPDGHQVIASK